LCNKKYAKKGIREFARETAKINTFTVIKVQIVMEIIGILHMF
jgi:hypothetical protein